MSIKTFKPTTPSRRQMTVSGFDGIDKKARPEPSLTEPLKKSSGRNSYGRITVRHRGGGNKRKYRIIDFKRDKMGSATAKTEIALFLEPAVIKIVFLHLRLHCGYDILCQAHFRCYMIVRKCA